jgi:hypothetical protein
MPGQEFDTWRSANAVNIQGVFSAARKSGIVDKWILEYWEDRYDKR